jgi:hypothetical protein
MTSALSGAGDAFDRSASALEASAQERLRLAREERKAKSVLTQAQVSKEALPTASPEECAMPENIAAVALLWF